MELNEHRFLKIAADEQTRGKLKEIFEVRRRVLAENCFEEDDKPFLLRLGKHVLVFDFKSSISAIETYQEIFFCNAHRKYEGFEGKDAAIVFDIGANRGFYSLAIRDVNKEAMIYAFEPNPVEYSVLCKHIELNNMHPVIACPWAVENKSVDSWMDVIPAVGTIGSKKMNIIPRKWIKPEFCKRLAVKAISLDDICAKYKITRVNILKIDTEGMEAEISG